jgi:hypothetical protein
MYKKRKKTPVAYMAKNVKQSKLLHAITINPEPG